MFRLFERTLDPTGLPPVPEPPPGLLAFYWHFARQARWHFAALFVAGFIVAVVDATIPVFMGRVVALVAEVEPATLLARHWQTLALFVGILLVVRPLALLAQSLVANQAIAANLSNLIRWQSHWHVSRQSWDFFQNDFAGRIANRVMQTGPSLRESLVALITGVFYIVVYGASALFLLASADGWLAVPVVAWLVTYVALLRFFVPRMRDRSRAVSDAKSWLMGRMVDAYTNILTVKLFARASDEDAYVREAFTEHTGLFYLSQRLTTLFNLSLTLLNASLVTGTGALAVALWVRGAVGVETVAMALPLTWQIVSIAGYVAWRVSEIFENVGVVQEGMSTIARPITLADPPAATPLKVERGAVEFKHIRFGYGRQAGLIDGLSLSIAPGERIGLIGRSGAGKSTLVNLMLRFFELEGGQILIDGQDISLATQESLRSQICVVTQDTSLLHRSIRENIRYGRPDATDEEVVAAAREARAHDFILELEDWKGRKGYDAHVGERGVKLSGGQRQRVAIARVILKNAPILVLDEATSSLDSEVESAIQAGLDTLMAGKTVIAIAHRLSTIARLDRLVVLDRGRIVEQGTHAELLGRGGLYEELWHHQSGGFLDAAPAA